MSGQLLVKVGGHDDVEVAVDVLDPMTGELVPLTGTFEELATWLDHSREYTTLLNDAKRVVQDVILEQHMDPTASWTHMVGRYKVTSGAPVTPRKWDGERLQKALRRLMRAGRISRSAAEAACKREVTFKPVVAGIKALEKLGPDIVEAIAACEDQTEPKPRNVSVSINTNGGGA